MNRIYARSCSMNMYYAYEEINHKVKCSQICALSLLTYTKVTKLTDQDSLT